VLLQIAVASTFGTSHPTMMDFFDLAEGSQRILRRLDQVLNDSPDPTQNGDPASTIYHTMQQEGAAGTRPVLSKSAEAELYLLATNFLLYVAMVIITAMVAKIYFPELVKRDTTPAPRSYNYRVAQEESEHYFDEEVEDEEEEDIEEESFIKETERPQYTRNSSLGFLEFHAESLSKTQVLSRLLFCSLMLNITFVSWGALQVCMYEAAVTY